MTETPDESDAGGWPDQRDRPRRRGRAAAVAALGVLAMAGIGVGLWIALRPSAPAAGGPEGVPIQSAPDLASANSTAGGSPVDGISCRTSMLQKVGYHIHVHLDIFVNGRQERIPAGAGIAAPRLAEHLTTGLFVDNGVDGCLYWLHVHSNDGILHIESPDRRTFTLGQFFDIWGQPLGRRQVGPATGPVTAFENGRRFSGNPRDLPLLAHAVIQLDVGSQVVPFRPVEFKVNGLCGAGTLNCSTSTG